VVSLVQALRSRLNVCVIEPSSPGSFPVTVESPFQAEALLLRGRATRVNCYLVPKSADIKMRYISALSHWSVESESEVIEFRGCEFDGRVLVRGRFYFQNDFLMQGIIAPKRAEFLTWADKVFRLAKKSLRRSNALDAYIGEKAEQWRQEGGRFAWMVAPERGPIYESEEPSISRKTTEKESRSIQ
jgi:hypothetical protein